MRYLIAIVILAVLWFLVRQQDAEAPTPSPTASPTASMQATLREPIARSDERVTKKPFGIFVTPKDSPVQLERFYGYHTGTDFETFADEQTTDVAVMAICTGPVATKRIADGYGGLVIQRCVLNGQDATILYGHVRLSSVSSQVGDTIEAGEQFAVLGTGFSDETDGERKHLHLGIHRGTVIDIRGYVQQQSELEDWIDPQLPRRHILLY